MPEDKLKLVVSSRKIPTQRRVPDCPIVVNSDGELMEFATWLQPRLPAKLIIVVGNGRSRTLTKSGNLIFSTQVLYLKYLLTEFFPTLWVLIDLIDSLGYRVIFESIGTNCFTPDIVIDSTRNRRVKAIPFSLLLFWTLLVWLKVVFKNDYCFKMFHFLLSCKRDSFDIYATKSFQMKEVSSNYTSVWLNFLT